MYYTECDSPIGRLRLAYFAGDLHSCSLGLDVKRFLLELERRA